MGAGQSVRKLTIENDEFEGNVIRISDSVAKRLAASSAASSASQSSSHVTNPEPARMSHSREISSGDSFAPMFTISALEMQQQKERELAEQESYYQKRLQNLEHTHEKINKAIEDEYKKALTIFDGSRGEITIYFILWYYNISTYILDFFYWNT